METKKKTSLPPAWVAMFGKLTEVARDHGYALTVLGSLSRDLDLVAIPWVESASPVEELVISLADIVSGFVGEPATIGGDPANRVRAHGIEWHPLILLGGHYIDLKVVPPRGQADAEGE